MNTQKIDLHVEDILRLLTSVVTADSKIYQQEIDGYLSAAAGLDLSNAAGEKLSREWLFDWFLQNCETIRAETSTPEFDNKIVHLFVRLQSWPEKDILLDALRRVAASDGQYHLNEKVLIALAAAYWDAETPAMN